MSNEEKYSACIKLCIGTQVIDLIESLRQMGHTVTIEENGSILILWK